MFRIYIRPVVLCSVRYFNPPPPPPPGMADFQVLPPGLNMAKHGSLLMDPELFQITGQSPHQLTIHASLCLMNAWALHTRLLTVH